MYRTLCTSQFGSQFDFLNMKFPPNGEIPKSKKVRFFRSFFPACATTPFQAIFEHDLDSGYNFLGPVCGPVFSPVKRDVEKV